MDWKTFAIVGRTFAQVFPNSLLVSAKPSGLSTDYLLVGFKGRQRAVLEYAEQKLGCVQQSKNVTLINPKLLYRFIASEDLEQLFGKGPINTDNKPILEFAAPKLMYQDDPAIVENIKAKGWIGAATKKIVQQVVTDVNAEIDFAAYALSVNAPFGNMVDLSKASPVQKERFYKLVESYCTKDMLDYKLFNEELTQRCLAIEIEYVKNNIDRMPDKAVSYFWLADSYHEKGMLDEAVTNYLNSLKLKYDNAELHANLGMTLNLLGRTDEAVVHLNEALRIKPAVAEVHRDLGIILSKQGKLSDAVKHYTEALRIKPNLVNVRRYLADTLVQQGKFDESIREYNKILQKFPDDPIVHNNLGIALAEYGKFDEAIAHFTKALQIKPDFADAKKNLNYAIEKRNKSK
jgi:spermidine synthase